MSALFRKKNIVTHETLGELLKKIRLGKNVTLETVSRQTKIARRYLFALEESLYDEMPGEVYLKNFIKQYSAYLELDQEVSLARLEHERHVIEQKNHHFLQELKPQTLIERLLLPRTIRLAAICLILTSVLSYLAWNVYHAIAPPTLFIYQPADNVHLGDLIVNVSGQSEPEVKVQINNKEIFVDESGKFTYEVSLREGLNLLVVTAHRKHGMEKKVLRHLLVDTDQMHVLNTKNSFN